MWISKIVKKSDKFLLVILCIDILFILLSFIDRFTALNFSYFLVNRDNLFAENFQYLKYIGISMLSFLLATKRKASQFFVFMIIPIYLYLDDQNRLHETFGNKIASLFTEGNPRDIFLISNVRFQDIGSVLYMSFVAFILLIIFLICFKLSKPSEKYFLKNILNYFFIFGFFAVIVDLIERFFKGNIQILLGIFEDGGEMIAISFIAAHFFKYLKNRKI